jgi:hypothetical protein
LRLPPHGEAVAEKAAGQTLQLMIFDVTAPVPIPDDILLFALSLAGPLIMRRRPKKQILFTGV